MFYQRFLKMILMVSVFMSLTCLNCFPSAASQESVVENGLQALEIAQEYFLDMGQNIPDSASMIIKLRDGVWTVRYVHPVQEVQSLAQAVAVALTGDGPQVEINKNSGEVIWSSLQ